MASDPTRRTILQAMGALGASAALGACTPAASEGPLPGEAELPPGAVMPTRRLGRTGQKVSIVGLGGYHMAVPRDEQESLRIVREAIDHGVNFLDNCWDYHDGQSEIRMGKALQDGYRQRAFLMSKIDGRTREAAAAQIEQSLRRLATDVIDLMQIHEVIRLEDPARVFAPGGAMEALVAARQAGKIRFVGFTGHKDPEIHLAMLKAAADHGFTFDTVQMPLNAMDPHYRSFEAKVLPVLVQHDIGVLGMKPLCSGDILKSGVVTAEECLRYAMSLPTSVVITGCDGRGVLEQALRAAYTFQPMTRPERDVLLARTAGAGARGEYEEFKTSEKFDATTRNPKWLEGAEL
jgi:aryl-alcohol dehydrogenase-like predicted oxidoreductase